MWQGSQPFFPWYSRGYLPYQSYDPAVGRLYFAVDAAGHLSACTGTVVAPNIVLTAAHCIVDPDTGASYHNWVFCPSQIGLGFPYGCWASRTATVWQYFYDPSLVTTSHSGFGPMDYGFVVMSQNVGDAVGYHGLLLNAPGTSPVFHTGYPASGPFGQYCPFASGNNTCFQWYCHSPIGGYHPYFTNWWEVGIGCLTGHGSSGGPWFELHNGTWYIASDMSTCWSATNNCANYSDNAWGPYFNDWTSNLLNYAKTL